VSPDKQFYHCFGCGAHGTAIGFLMNYEKLAFQEAVADLAQRAGLELPREALSPQEHGGNDLYAVNSQASRFFEQNLADTERARAYVKQRGIDAPTVAKFALGYAPDSWNALLNRFGGHEDERRALLQSGLIIERDTKGGERKEGFYDRFRDRLMFPIRDSRGRTLAFGGRIIDAGEPKYLNSPETPLFHKGRELYGLYEARQAHSDFKRLMIVEGYMDVVRLYQAGITYAVATLGTATTQEHLNKLFRLTNELVFSFDGDRAGRQAAWRALENALPLARDGRELKFLFLPEGHDPDSLVAEEGKDAFEARLKAALPLSDYLVEQLKSQVDLSSVAGRARLKALAEPLFAKMPEGVYRELLLDKLAADIHMSGIKLKSLLMPGSGTKANPPPEPPRQPRGRISIGRGNLLTQAIVLVLHHPQAARAIANPQSLDDIDRPGVNVLKELLEQAISAKQASTGVLLERWRDRPEYARLAELAQADPLVPNDGAAAKELAMAVEKLLEESGPGRRMDELLRKAGDLGLNYEEKAELSTLLQSRGRPRAPS
jgi:DNA primase